MTAAPAPRLNRTARREHESITREAPAPTHPDVRAEIGIPVAAHDGTPLLTDHWFAEGAGDTTLLIRTPYGRENIAGVAQFFAERGHHVVVQSCRGTFGSGGTFNPLHDEAADGQATLAWLRAQPWATGMVLSWGGSYFGVTQWAMCEGPLRPDAMGIAVSARRFDEAIIYDGGGFSIDTVLSWALALDLQEQRPLGRIWRMLRAFWRLRRASLAVPPTTATRVLHTPGARFVGDWLAHADAGDPWWTPLHFADDVSTIPPTVLVAGWQDLFLDAQLDDYRALRDGGAAVRLIIGDWRHGEPETIRLGVHEALSGFADPTAGVSVRVEVTGGAGWRDLEQWPPASTPEAWEASPDGALRAVDASAPSMLPSATLGYRYDPADPTPDGGGRTLNPFSAGRRNQAKREQRDDVLVFTADPLAADLVVLGTPEVEFTLTSTNPRVDVFVRLCEVDDRGVSTTISDGYRRLDPAGDDTTASRRLRLPLSPIAHRFSAGRRLRLQVSSGAHPLHLRNPGTADPVRDFSELRPSDQTVGFGGADALRITLPAVER